MTEDRITANLPAIDFEATAAFYAKLGFVETYHDDGWMILTRGPLVLEFFHHPQLVPSESWFSACVRIKDIDALYAAWSLAGLPDHDLPRLTPPRDEPWGKRMFALIDLNGSLLRCIGD
ncbi:bleomycin resistance protein [Asticcacaulis sp. BYS171W]|uniref:Bleomycin resistance protein n=1 Tax=Asticcacaulis aquaticus TaxID=2984212 RepID=A0ABT5HYZ2_9CAUL|nr:bleomycin resistance protein [Asticcacaulis aquaticus]MDC7685305.1 bleomycin resistance protein [Asticcacaulis aquaticus]